MASYPASSRPPVQSGSGAFYGAAALLLGLGRRRPRVLRADDVGGCA